MRTTRRAGWMLLLGLTLIASPALATSLLFDGATGITWGDFTVQDVTADVETTYFNPSLMAEFRFGGDDKFGVGLAYAQSENDFTGEWDDEGEHTEGDLTVERKTLDAYFRLLAGPHFNLRFGYRHYQYDFTDGYLEKSDMGEVYEIDDQARGSGDLTKGLDLELNFCAGNAFQFRFGLGFGYFFDAEYDWYFVETDLPSGDVEVHQGDATLDAYAARIKPEFTFQVVENLRITLDYTLAASIWEGDVDDAAIEDFPGVEVYSAFGIGIEYLLPL